MRQITSESLGFVGTLGLALAGTLFAGQAFAQQKTVEQKEAGPTEVTVNTRNTTVAYVENDYLVVRLEDGMLEAMRIPPGERFDIDGESLTLDQLKPGMTLTHETITTTRPIVVKTVEVTDGTVYFVAGKHLSIRMTDGNVVRYIIPEWAEISLNGEEVPLSQLHQGDQVTAKFITEEPMTVGELEVRTHGHQAVAEEQGATPEEAAATETTPPETTGGNETETEAATPEKLPETGSLMPLIGLLGVLGLAASFGLRSVRKSL